MKDEEVEEETRKNCVDMLSMKISMEYTARVKGTRNEHEIENFQENHGEMMKKIYCTIRSRLLGLP